MQQVRGMNNQERNVIACLTELNITTTKQQLFVWVPLMRGLGNCLPECLISFSICGMHLDYFAFFCLITWPSLMFLDPMFFSLLCHILSIASNHLPMQSFFFLAPFFFILSNMHVHSADIYSSRLAYQMFNVYSAGALETRSIPLCFHHHQLHLRRWLPIPLYLGFLLLKHHPSSQKIPPQLLKHRALQSQQSTWLPDGQ